MRGIVLLIVFSLVFSCKSHSDYVAEALQPAEKGDRISRDSLEAYYQRYISAVSPGKTFKHYSGLIRKGILFDGGDRLPVEITVNKRPVYFSVVVKLQGANRKIVEYSVDSLIHPQGLKNEDRKNIKQMIVRIAQCPVAGIFVYFVQNHYTFFKKDNQLAGDIETTDLYTFDGDYRWDFYLDKKTGLLVRLTKSDKNGMLFAIDFMDFRNKNGLMLSYHMIVHDKTNNKKSYIWKKITLKP